MNGITEFFQTMKRLLPYAQSQWELSWSRKGPWIFYSVSVSMRQDPVSKTWVAGWQVWRNKETAEGVVHAATAIYTLESVEKEVNEWLEMLADDTDQKGQEGLVR